MKTTDLPAMLDEYFRDAMVVLAHPRSFANRLGLETNELFTRGTKFALKSVAVSFLLLVPVFWLHGRIGKVEMYELVLLFIVVAYGAAIHVFLKLLGGSGTLKDTIGVYGFFVGMIAPLHVVLGYPMYLKFGPELALAASPKTVEGLYPNGFPGDATAFIATNVMVIWIFEFGWTLFSALPNLAHVHKFAAFGSLRTGTALLLPFVAAFLAGLLFG